MNETHGSTAGNLILCQRKGFRDAVSLGGVVFGVLTLGLGFLVLYGIYGLVPRQIRVESGHLFADKILPPEGVPFASITQVTVRTLTVAMSVEVARTVEVEITDQGKRSLIAINRRYYPEDEVERAADFLAKVKEG